MFFSTCDNDDSIGPGVSNCRDGFDFTVVFELLFFTVVPSAIFILFSLQRTVFLTRRRIIVNAPVLQVAKLVRSRNFSVPKVKG
jgi:ATP-binding cassette subfamily C (CFTR/MRP) protein 1